MELFKVIMKRKSIREFSDKPLKKEDIDTIAGMAYKIPSAGALYPLTIYVIKKSLVPCLFIICADFDKTTVKYGRRGVRYVFMEAGHAAQNILLCATALGLASYPIGAFEDKILKQRFNLKDHPIYMVAVGYEKGRAIQGAK